MALAVFGLGEAEAVSAAVGVALLQVEFPALTLVAGLAFHSALAETLSSGLKKRICIQGFIALPSSRLVG